MKRRGPRTKWQRIVREVVFELLIGGAIGLGFDAVLFIWLGYPISSFRNSIVIVSLLHDLGKMGQFGKANYVPNMLKGRATKANPDPAPKQSEAQPYKSNPDLMYVDHEVRSVAIASKFIDLTEEEQQAILWHNGLYGPFKYEIQGNETLLYMILHFADLWSSRVTEEEECNE